MPQMLWVEPVGARRTDGWYRQVIQQLTAASSALYVVPDATPLAEVIGRLLAVSERPTLAGDGVMTLSQWLHRLSDRAQPVAPLPLRVLTMAHQLRRASPHYFSSRAHLVATARHLLNALGNALRAGIDPTALQRCAESIGGERERDLALVAHRYLAALHEDGMIDPAETTIAALAAMQRPLPWRTIMIEAGVMPSPILPSLLNAIASRADCQLHTILSTADADDLALAQVTQRIRSLCDTTVRDVSVCELEASDPADITLYCSPSSLAEARWVASTMTQLFNEGLAPEQIGLVLVDDTQAALYHRCFADAGLCRAPEALSGTDLLRRHFTRDATWTAAPATATWFDWVTWLHTQIMQRCPPERLAAEIREMTAQRANPTHTAAPRGNFVGLTQELEAWQNLWTGLAVRQRPTDTLSQTLFRELVIATAPCNDAFSMLHAAVPIRCYRFDAQPHQPLDTLFLPNACEGALPSIRRSEFFSQTGHAMPPNHLTFALAFPNAEQQFHQAARQWRRWRTMANHIRVSYPEAGQNGRPRFVSSLIAQDGIASAVIATPMLAPAASFHTSAHAASINARATHERVIQQRIEQPTDTLLLTDPAVQTHLRERFANHVFSVTALQHFVTCPFHFFAQHLLGIAKPYADTPDLDHRTKGDWMHRSLARLYGQHAAAWRTMNGAVDSLRADIATQVHDTLRAVSHEMHAQLERHAAAFRAHTHDVLTELITECILTDIALWQHAGDTAFTPTYFEWAFGKGDVPPCHVQDATTTVAVRGQIDRIDVHAALHEFLVVDYKAGKDASLFGELKAGRHLQLPLYLLAVQQHLLSDHQAAGGLLHHLRTNVRKHGLVRRDIGKQRLQISGQTKSSMTDAQWDACLQTAVASAIAAVQQLRAGRIPWGRHACTQCDWLGLSRYEARSWT